MKYMYVLCTAVQSQVVAQPIASSPTQPAAPLNAAMGMPDANTYPAPGYFAACPVRHVSH